MADAAVPGHDPGAPEGRDSAKPLLHHAGSDPPLSPLTLRTRNEAGRAGGDPRRASLTPAMFATVQRVAGNSAARSLLSRPDAGRRTASAAPAGRSRSPGDEPQIAVQRDDKSAGSGPPNAPASAQADDGAPSASPAGPTAASDHQEPTGSGLRADPQVLRQQAEQEKATVLQAAAARKQQLATDAEQQKTAQTATLDAEAERLEEAATQGAAQVNQALTAAKGQVQANKDAKTTSTRAAATTEIAALSALAATKKAALIAAGAAKADAITAVGQAESARASSVTAAKAGEATQIGARKTQQYAAGKGAAEIAKVAQSMSSQAAEGIRRDGAKLAEGATRAASDLAARFRHEAQQASEQVDKVVGKRVEKVEKSRDKAVSYIAELASAAVSQLDENAKKALTAISTQRGDAAAQVHSLDAPTRAGLEQVVADATTKVDEAATRTNTHVDVFVGESAGAISSRPDQAGQQLLNEALARVQTTTPAFTTEVDRFVTGVRDSTRNQLTELAGQVRGGVDQAVAPLNEGVTAFQTSARTIATGAGQKIDETATETATEMHSVTTETGIDLDEAINKCQAKWTTDLADGTRQIREQVDRGLAEHDKTISNLSSKIDDKAAEAQSQGFWSTLGSGVLNVLSFIGGLVVGILEAAWEVVVGIWNLLVALVKALASGSFIVWFMLAVIVALLVLIFIFAGGWVGVAIFIGALLLAAGIVFAVLGLIKAYGYLKDAFTKPGLSWYQRGKLIGKAIFEIGMALLVVAEWLKLGKAGEAGKVGEGGEAARAGVLGELKAKVGGTNAEALVKELGEEGAKSLVDRLGPEATKEGLTKLTPTELNEFVTKFGEAKVISYLAKYGAEALKHYGVEFFAQYQGVTLGTIAHLLVNDGIKKGSILGCHDRATFFAELKGKGEVVQETPHPTRPDVAELQYKLYRKKSDGTLELDATGKPVLSTGQPKIKTVINDLAGNSAEWQRLATEAADNGIKSQKLPAGGGLFQSPANSGLSMTLAYRAPQIDTFFPDM